MSIHCPTPNTRPSGTTAFCFRQVIKIPIGRNIIIQIMLANVFHAEGNLAKLGWLRSYMVNSEKRNKTN